MTQPTRYTRRDALRAGLPLPIAALAAAGTTATTASRPAGAASGRADAGWRTLATGLQFPESPIPLRDGSVLVVEIARGTLTRVSGSVNTVVANLGGGPNGAAIGPDGACYVVNNGGFTWNRSADGALMPGGAAADWSGGWVDRVDLGTGRHTTLYRECAGRTLSAPNDLVFDAHGGFYMTDNGRGTPDHKEHGAIYYGHVDGRPLRRLVHPLDSPNGLALSPDGSTLYVALTTWRMVLAFPVRAPGELDPGKGVLPGRLVASLGGLELLDSMTVDAEGNINVATVVEGGVLTLSPTGRVLRRVRCDDLLTTSIRIGGADLRTAFVTLGTTGRLVARRWPFAGLPPQHVA